MIIYIDILIILNMFVDYLLLLSCSILLKIKLKKLRLILGAVVGSLFSLFILLPELNVFLNLFLKILSGSFLVLIAFGFKEKLVFLKAVIIFFGENLIFIGMTFFIWVFVSPPSMFFKNGVTYISISPFVLIVSSLFAYIATSIIDFFLSRRVNSKKIYKIEVEFNGNKIFLDALYDSGNCLVEPFSGKPVCVCEYRKLIKFFSDEFVKFFEDFFKNVGCVENLNLKKKIKLIPCDTVSGSIVLPAFCPQSFYVLDFNGERKAYDCLVAVTIKNISDGEYAAIIGDFN